MTVVRTLVIDETLGHQSVARLLEADGDISSVTARRMSDAVIEVSKHQPDVVVMVPGSERAALAAIAEVMSQRPVPILLLSEGPLSRIKALSAGAVDVMAKPGEDVERHAAIRRRVRSISALKVASHAQPALPRTRASGVAVVGIAASTGGPQAVAKVLASLRGLPASCLVVQHIHPDFMPGFQTWMDRECPLPVVFASDREVMRTGRVYIAPANVHLKLAPGRRLVLDPEPDTLHRPSADVLFTSMAAMAGRRAVGVLLTGMGQDGVEGLLAIRRAGGRTIVQDQRSSAVYGMPRAAAEAGAAERVVPLEQIGRAISVAIGGRA